MSKKKSAWRIWAKALGAKEGKDDREADIIAGIRTLIFISYLVTNVFIVSGVIRHWDDKVNSNSHGHTTHKEGSNVSGTTPHQ